MCKIVFDKEKADKFMESAKKLGRIGKCPEPSRIREDLKKVADMFLPCGGFIDNFLDGELKSASDLFDNTNGFIDIPEFLSCLSGQNKRARGAWNLYTAMTILKSDTYKEIVGEANER